MAKNRKIGIVGGGRFGLTLAEALAANGLDVTLVEKDWNVVQPWLAPLDRNSEIVAREDRRAAQENSVIALPPAEEVRVLRPVRRPRRSAVAQY